jgi:hypothetical protein
MKRGLLMLAAASLTGCIQVAVELDDSRLMTARDVRCESGADRRVREALAVELDRFRVPRGTLSGLVEYLRARNGMNVFVHWGALKDAGVTASTEVRTDVKDVQLETALRIALDEASGSVGLEDRLRYTIRDGMLVISTSAQLDQDEYVVLYDVSDLLRPVEGWAPFSGVPATRGQQEDDEEPFWRLAPSWETPAERGRDAFGDLRLAHALADIVHDAVYGRRLKYVPTPDPIGYFEGRLIARANEREHETIRRALATLRSMRGLDWALPSHRPLSQARQALERRLQTVLEKVDFSEGTLAEAIDVLRRTGTPIHVKWGALKEVGCTPQTPVTLHLGSVTVETALRWLCASVSSPGLRRARLGAVKRDGVLVISTNADLDREMQTETYVIRRLVRESVTARLAAAGLGPPDRNAAQCAVETGRFAGQVTAMIRQNVDPGSWRDGPYSGAWMAYVDGMLVIQQTQRNHERICRLLEALVKLAGEGRGIPLR